MPKLVSLLASLALLVCVAFCAFGFLATFEPLPPAKQWTWRAVYLVATALCLGLLVRLWRAPRRPARK